MPLSTARSRLRFGLRGIPYGSRNSSWQSCSRRIVRTSSITCGTSIRKLNWKNPQPERISHRFGKEGSRRVRRQIPHDNLDMIISVGCRVKSGAATKFRIWATDRLKEYLVQGAAINRRRLEQLGSRVEIPTALR